MATFDFSTSGDFGTEDQGIARRRKMAEALQAQAMQPLGQSSAPISPLQVLAKLAQGYFANKRLGEIDDEQSVLSNRKNEALIRGLQDYQKASQGMPAETFTVGEGIEGPVGTRPAVAGNRQEAMAQLLRSGHPALQQLGMQQMLKEQTPAKWSTTPHYDQQGNAFLISETGEMRPLQGVKSRDKKEIAPSGVVYNPYGITEGSIFNDPNKIMGIGADGQPVVNQPYVNAKKDIAKAGASNVSVNTATKPFLTEIGKGVGEAVNNAYAGAQSAVGTLNNVQQIRQGLNSAIVGPGANARLKLAQVGQMLGVGGKNAEEQLQNTRNVIQGLARQELSAAGQMKGQGQITESERGILRRAEAGDISEFTKPELQTLLGALEKTANSRIAAHNSNMERLRQDPNAAGIVDYMTVTPPTSQQQTPQENGGFSIRRLP